MKQDNEPLLEREFGGATGVSGFIIFSHFLVYYLWISQTYYQGSLINPFNLSIWNHVIEGASPTFYGSALYFGFVFFELALAYIMPGVIVLGLPVPTENNVKHIYLCNGLASWYVTLVTLIILEVTDIFHLSSLVDHLGSFLTISILFADITSILAYVITILQNKSTRMSGNVVYDFFMGAILNPRIGIVDLKFFAEIRISWILLFLLTLSAADKQYDTLGYVSWPMIFLITAQGLYTNACMKGEECIPATWDVFYEKWGWMLIFWNLSGVPFVYSFNAFYILQNNPELGFMTFVYFVMLFIAYYIWDTSQSQKARFRLQLKGEYKDRRAFPQLPWGTLRNPKYLTTANGGTLLVDGWWAYAQKIHYTADIIMAFTWGLCCGYSSILPYFYPIFFFIMIMHRSNRDQVRCAQKYGEDWVKYTQIVPYRFVPYVY